MGVRDWRGTRVSVDLSVNAPCNYDALMQRLMFKRIGSVISQGFGDVFRSLRAPGNLYAQSLLCSAPQASPIAQHDLTTT